MSEDWAAAAADIASALAEVGFSATLVRGATLGQATPWATTPAGPAATVPVTLLQSDFSRSHQDRIALQADDRMFMMSAAVTPTPADSLLLPGDPAPLRIIAVFPLAPGNVNLLFEVQARK